MIKTNKKRHCLLWGQGEKNGRFKEKRKEQRRRNS